MTFVQLALPRHRLPVVLFVLTAFHLVRPATAKVCQAGGPNACSRAPVVHQHNIGLFQRLMLRGG
eukprot:3694932-Pyramimonas_sp.AAC.3